MEVTRDDVALVADIVAKGDMTATEALIKRYQSWIYNLAVSMVYDREDARDLTQEILMRVLANLASYDPGKAAFKTWLWRVAANHCLNMRKRKAEEWMTGLGDYGQGLDRSLEAADPRGELPEDQALETEVRIECSLGMLLCLSRQERLAFLLGQVFGFDGPRGASIMEIREAGFRKLLSRSRAKVGAFIRERCGAVNPRRRCSCAVQGRAMVASGQLDRGRMPFHDPEAPTLARSVGTGTARIHGVWQKYLGIFHENPFYEDGEVAARVKTMLSEGPWTGLFMGKTGGKPCHGSEALS